MTETIVIAVDAMGGDRGPEVVVGGAALSIIRHPQIRFRFYGDAAKVRPLVEQQAALAGKYEVIHTDVAVGMDDKPSQALMRGRGKSSMWLAIDAVKSGEAHVVISAGNTGALMAMAKVCLKMLPGVDRPALSAVWPTVSAECLVLDVGATVEASRDQLVEFALMGAAMARKVFDVERATVGLLNIGVEEIKGLEAIKDANALLRAGTFPFDYVGFVEGDGIGHGLADVIVTDGFTGNIALKTAEGTARQIAVYLRQAMNRTLIARLGGLLAKGAFEVLRRKLDPRRMNGGVFLGVDGLVIKSHGGTDALGFASAIDLGHDLARDRLIGDLAADLATFKKSEVSSATG